MTANSTPQFSFKFTKGTIKVNPQKLESFQHKHSDHLLSNPTAHLPILRSSLLSPAESYIRHLEHLRSSPPPEEIKSTSGRIFDFSQRGDLLPQFASQESSEAYLLRLFQQNTTRYPTPADLVVENPQLIWDIPPSVYAHTSSNLTSKSQASTILSTLDTEVAPLKAAASEEWDKKALQSAISHVIEALSPGYPAPEAARDAIYEALRFALMGDPHLPSKPASMVMYILGPGEVSARFSRAAEALR